MDVDMDTFFFSERLKAASVQDLQKAFAEAARKLVDEADPVTCNISAMDYTRMHSISMTLTISSTPTLLSLCGSGDEGGATGG